MTEVQKEKNSNLPPKHFTFLLSFLLTSAYKPQPMERYLFWKISGTTELYDRLPPNDYFSESQSKKSYFFRVPRGLPGDPPTAEPENSGLEIGALAVKTRQDTALVNDILRRAALRTKTHPMSPYMTYLLNLFPNGDQEG